MTGQILYFNGVTRHDIPAERVLSRAAEADLEPCIVLGMTPDGNLYFSASMADGGDAMWLMELAKHSLLSVALDLETNNQTE